VCLLKWSAIYVLLQQQLYSALVLFPLLGRLVPLMLFLSTRYVRAQGLGSSIAEFIPKTAAIFVISLCLMASAYWGWSGILSSVCFIMTVLYLRFKFMQRIGGITGDTVGAGIEITEAISLLSFVIASFYLPLTWF
jgi:adenosylcobinamide-GDP ribazoletransferase